MKGPNTPMSRTATWLLFCAVVGVTLALVAAVGAAATPDWRLW